MTQCAWHPNARNLQGMFKAAQPDIAISCILWDFGTNHKWQTQMIDIALPVVGSLFRTCDTSVAATRQQTSEGQQRGI